jgi:3-isopropylmalate/(R)-2-methylmalate dehydratase small subunit
MIKQGGRKMESILKMEGKVVPFDRSNIDTDAILPKEFLKRIEKTGFGQFLFHYWRFHEDGTEKKDFILNQEQYRNSTILIARKNFGCGSSREHAPWALKDYGIKVIIAESIADIFYNNCLKNGILPIVLKREEINFLFDAVGKHKDYSLEISLESCSVTDKHDFYATFAIGDFRRKMLMEGLDDIDWTLRYMNEISKFEQGHSVHYRSIK